MKAPAARASKGARLRWSRRLQATSYGEVSPKRAWIVCARRRRAPRAPRNARLPVRLAIRRASATVAAVMIGGGTSVLACPVCFGAEETPLIDGAKLGVLVMLAITFAVQGGFLGFFLYLRKRAKHIADVELDSEWSELQRGSRAS